MIIDWIILHVSHSLRNGLEMKKSLVQDGLSFMPNSKHGQYNRYLCC